MRLTNTPSPIPNQPPNQPQQVKQAPQTAPTEQTQQTQQTPTTPVLKKPQLKKTKTSLQVQKKQQLSSPQTQQHITNTIWKKGVVHTEQPPKLNMLKGHVTVEKAKHKEKAKESSKDEETSKVQTKSSSPEETQNTSKTEQQESVHQQEQEKQLEQPKEQEKEKPKDQEQDKGGRGGQQQQQGSRQGRQQHEEPEHESHSEQEDVSPIGTNTGSPTKTPMPSFDPTNHPKVSKDNIALLKRHQQDGLTQKSILDNNQHSYKKDERSTEHVAKGVEKTYEKAFDKTHDYSEKTVFMNSTATQNLNKVNFTDGHAKTTLLKQYEDLSHGIESLESTLKDPQTPKEHKESLTKDIKHLKSEQTILSKDVQQLSKLADRYDQLVAQKADPKKIAQAKQELEKLEGRVSSKLQLMTSDVDVSKNPETRIKRGARAQNRMIFVMSPKGEIYAMDQTKRDIELPDGHTVISEAKIHHTTMLNGQNISGAGELRIGSQLKDLSKEVNTKDKETHPSDQVDQNEESFDKAMKQITQNAEKGVERRFVEAFKSKNIKGLNEQIQKIESHTPISLDNQKKLGGLKAMRTELINESFLSTNTPPSALAKQFASDKEKHFVDFKKKALPQILHNVIEAQFPKGQVEVLSDQSGHYQPEMNLTGQTVNQLQKKGVEVEKLTVNLGSKGIGQEELRLPATGVQGFVDFGHTETDLREFDKQKQTMHQELMEKMGTVPPSVKPSDSTSSPLRDNQQDKHDYQKLRHLSDSEGTEQETSEYSVDPLKSTDTGLNKDEPYVLNDPLSTPTTLSTTQTQETESTETESTETVTSGYTKTNPENVKTNPGTETESTETVTTGYTKTNPENVKTNPGTETESTETVTSGYTKTNPENVKTNPGTPTQETESTETESEDYMKVPKENSTSDTPSVTSTVETLSPPLRDSQQDKDDTPPKVSESEGSETEHQESETILSGYVKTNPENLKSNPGTQNQEDESTESHRESTGTSTTESTTDEPYLVSKKNTETVQETESEEGEFEDYEKTQNTVNPTSTTDSPSLSESQTSLPKTEHSDGVTHWGKDDERQSKSEQRDQSVQMTSLEKRLETVTQTIQETELALTSNPNLSKTQTQELQEVLQDAKSDQKVIESQIQKLTQKPEPETISQTFKAPNAVQPLEGLIADCIRQQEKDLTKAILPSSKREVLQTAQNNVKKMVENASSDSDLLLHLATKSESDLYVDTIKSMGLLKVKYGEELTPIISKYENDKNTFEKSSKITSELNDIVRQLKYENNPELIKQGQERYASKLKELDPNLKPVYDQLPNSKLAHYPTVPKPQPEPELNINQLKDLLSSKKLDLVESVVTGLKEGQLNSSNRILSSKDDPVFGKIPDTFTMGGKTYQFDKLLAQGGGGAVFTYKDTQSGEEVVLKKSIEAPLSVETKDHHYVKGDHVIEMKAALRSEDGEVFMILEKATGDLTSVHQKINDLNLSAPLKEQVALTMISDVIKGMSDIHNQKATHNDMKSGNVYIDKNGTSKVADMGEMKINDPKVSGEFGTPLNNAPEIKDDQRVGDRFKNDIWCTGLMLYGMLNQPDHPFSRLDIEKSIDRTSAERKAIVEFGKDPNNRIFSQHPITPVQELINTMMHPDPNQRPTFDMLSKMPIFQDLNPKVKSLISAVATKDDQQVLSLKMDLES